MKYYKNIVESLLILGALINNHENEKQAPCNFCWIKFVKKLKIIL